jgi:long-subunit acyl-CoA synthetase (AMP-forming)
MDNGIDWVLIDLAAQCAGITLVPLPPFFSTGQIEYIFGKANIDAVISIDRKVIPDKCTTVIIKELAPGVNLYKCAGNGNVYNLLKHTGKITFTSGTTGTPKGVCLTNESIARVANSLLAATQFVDIENHLSLLPLSTLLENIAGIYAPLLKGATCQVPSLNETGLTGSTGFDVIRMLECLERYQPDSVILLPQMLNDMVYAAESGIKIPGSLKFIAVGGGVISPSIIKRARTQKLPVYEGYGLSECGSVVALNTPQYDRPGSAGKPLNNIDVSLADDGEIMVKGNFMQGYLGGHAINNTEWLATGDIGEIDEDGYLYVTGRKKNIFITSFGRNVSPEWTESELINTSAIKQAVVFGEARPVNCAVIVPVSNYMDDHLIEVAIDLANKNLPDYARVYYWVKAKESFNLKNSLASTNGHPVREKIYKLYENEINHCYENLLISGSA